MNLKTLKILSFLTIVMISSAANAAKENGLKTILVEGSLRQYLLYVPDSLAENPALVVSLHGAGGFASSRQPFSTSVADEAGCIVVYPQGEIQNFYMMGMKSPGWDSTGEDNKDVHFLKAIVNQVAKNYEFDHNRIYCCGFSNGGMMTYANASAAADFFAAYASISGFQLNEYHLRFTGARPVPFLHIHGKTDDLVRYVCLPTICDNMVARNGCNPIPEVVKVDGKYKKSTYAAGEGGFPYVCYEISGMGHSPSTSATEDGDAIKTMWKFMSQYRLDDACDKTLKWSLNPDTEGYIATEHGWTINDEGTVYEYGTPKTEDNADNNVYHSLQFAQGNHKLVINSVGDAGNSLTVKLEVLGGEEFLTKTVKVGEEAEIPFAIAGFSEYKITITKQSATDKLTKLAFYSAEDATGIKTVTGGAAPQHTKQLRNGHLVISHQGHLYDEAGRSVEE